MVDNDSCQIQLIINVDYLTYFGQFKKDFFVRRYYNGIKHSPNIINLLISTSSRKIYIFYMFHNRYIKTLRIRFVALLILWMKTIKVNQNPER